MSLLIVVVVKGGDIDILVFVCCFEEGGEEVGFIVEVCMGKILFKFWYLLKLIGF